MISAHQIAIFCTFFFANVQTKSEEKLLGAQENKGNDDDKLRHYESRSIINFHEAGTASDFLKDERESRDGRVDERLIGRLKQAEIPH